MLDFKDILNGIKQFVIKLIQPGDLIMNLKKILYASALLFVIKACAAAEDNDINRYVNLREMFQNNQAVIYAVNLRTFNADDKNGNGIIEFELGETSGTFLNAAERLDEIKELGVNTLHLLPVTPTGKMKAIGTAGSLYALSDFRTFNMQLADSNSGLSIKKQAEIFVNECHKRGIKVIADLPSCGAYDLFLNRPDLFVLEEDGSAVIPADWNDVRLFNVPDDEKLLKSDIFILHKMFVNNLIDIGIDGIRADVATLKPNIFWKELIKYARSRNSSFLFLAEASESWTKPASSKAYFTNYKKLLEAGFDGYYGNYFELKNWHTADKLHNAVISKNRLFKKYKEKKSVIGSFATHDEPSPLITGGEAFAKIIIWLNASLPLNPYYTDGFLQGDDYLYDYANKKASETYTDDEYYYVFNFSRKPGGGSDLFIKEHKSAIKLRNEFHDVIEKGKYIPLKTDNSSVFAFQRHLNGRSVIVIFNRNLTKSEEFKVKIKYYNKKTSLNFIKNESSLHPAKSLLTGALKAGGVIVITAE